MEIFSVNGERIFNTAGIQSGAADSVSWDFTDMHGNTVKSGMYICKIALHADGNLKIMKNILVIVR